MGKGRWLCTSYESLPGIIPCRRVVNREGKVAEAFDFGGGAVQKQLLESEGVVFEPDGKVDLKKYGI